MDVLKEKEMEELTNSEFEPSRTEIIPDEIRGVEYHMDPEKGIRVVDLNQEIIDIEVA